MKCQQRPPLRSPPLVAEQFVRLLAKQALEALPQVVTTRQNAEAEDQAALKRALYQEIGQIRWSCTG